MRVVDKTIRLTEIQRAAHPVDEIIVMLGGDMIENIQTFPGQPFEVDSTLFGMIFEAANLIEAVLLRLLEEYATVRVYEVAGNHGRIGKKTDGVPDNWEHMLQQTGEWEGTLFGLPDQVDRYRAVTFAAAPDGKKGDARPLQPAGTYWEYNDVRINQLSLALLHLFQRPLPEVFREAIMQPVGASDTWNWVGYDDAWVDIAGKRVQSVPGGTHWGGGMSISSEDQALVGQMLLDNGMAQGKRVLSSEWITRMRTPCAIAPFYGYLVWLNDQRKVFPSLPETSYFAVGAGSSFTWIEPELNMVVIIRWLNSAHADAVFGKIYEAVKAIAK